MSPEQVFEVVQAELGSDFDVQARDIIVEGRVEVVVSFRHKPTGNRSCVSMRPSSDPAKIAPLVRKSYPQWFEWTGEQ